MRNTSFYFLSFFYPWIFWKLCRQETGMNTSILKLQNHFGAFTCKQVTLFCWFQQNFNGSTWCLTTEPETRCTTHSFQVTCGNVKCLKSGSEMIFKQVNCHSRGNSQGPAEGSWRAPRGTSRDWVVWSRSELVADHGFPCPKQLIVKLGSWKAAMEIYGWPKLAKDEVDSQLNQHSGTGNGLLCWLRP